MPASPTNEKNAAAVPAALKFLLDHPVFTVLSAAGLHHTFKDPSYPGLDMVARPDFRTRAGYPKEYDMPIQFKTAEEFTKEGAGGFGKGLMALLQGLFGEGAKSISRSLPTGKILGLGAGVAGLGLASDLLEPTVDTLAYRLQKATQPWHERIKLPDILAESAAKGSGGGGAEALLGLAADIFQRGSGAAGGMVSSFQRQGILKGLLKDDPVLANAAPSELMKHYDTMAKFAPSLAMDENAARSFLRESVMSQMGPDYGTIAGLARAEQNVQDIQR